MRRFVVVWKAYWSNCDLLILILFFWYLLSRYARWYWFPIFLIIEMATNSSSSSLQSDFDYLSYQEVESVSLTLICRFGHVIHLGNWVLANMWKACCFLEPQTNLDERSHGAESNYPIWGSQLQTCNWGHTRLRLHKVTAVLILDPLKSMSETHIWQLYFWWVS